MTDDLRDDEAVVGPVLRSRPDAPVRPGFAARVSARLDEEAGVLGLTDWRAWTFRFAPVAVALIVVAALLPNAAEEQDLSLTTAVETWAAGDRTDGRPAASLLWQEDVSADSLLDAVLRAGADDEVDESGSDSPGGVQ